MREPAPESQLITVALATALDEILAGIRVGLEADDAVRELALQDSRALTRLCARSIRAMHREEWETADALLQEAAEAASVLVRQTQATPKVYAAGYTQDALKEYVEACHLYALIRRRPLLTPEALGVDGAVWLNGLCEASSELRRRILDIMRHGHNDEAERLLAVMDDIYSILITIDFHDSITGGLRHRTDNVRGVLERTRGDVTQSLRQARLEQALLNMEQRLIS